MKDPFESLRDRTNTPGKKTITELLRVTMKKIGKEYDSGCTEWATHVPGNEWDRAFAELDRSLAQDSDGLVRKKIVWFESHVLAMVRQYKKIKIGQRDFFKDYENSKSV